MNPRIPFSQLSMPQGQLGYVPQGALVRNLNTQNAGKNLVAMPWETASNLTNKEVKTSHLISTVSAPAGITVMFEDSVTAANGQPGQGQVGKWDKNEPWSVYIQNIPEGGGYGYETTLLSDGSSVTKLHSENGTIDRELNAKEKQDLAAWAEKTLLQYNQAVEEEKK